MKYLKIDNILEKLWFTCYKPIGVETIDTNADYFFINSECDVMCMFSTGQMEMEILDQVYCAWLINWVIRREIIQLAELCFRRWWIISGTWWYRVSIWQYWLVLGQYKLVLLGIRWYRVSKGLVCLYILEKVEIWSGVTDPWHTDRQQNIVLLSLSPV